MTFLEIACFNTQSALIAQEAGADRIEFCTGAHVGGTTPSLSDYRFLLEVQATTKSHRDVKEKVPIYIMIRPRGGDFVYTDSEFQCMKEDLLAFKNAGRTPEDSVVDGFVFGILDPQNHVDKARNCELIRLASPARCTFHRAFDEVLRHDPARMEQALNDAVDCGFHAVLTSGGEVNAMVGRERLADLIESAHGRIDIIVGGGVRSSNIQALREKTLAEYFHSSAIIINTSSAAEGDDVASADELRSLKRLLR